VSDPTVSNWIPRRRIRIAATIAAGLTIGALTGVALSAFALVLLLPAACAAWAAHVMLSIRRHLSDNGGGTERRIHDLVVAQLALDPAAELDVLDIGCGDAGLIIRFHERSRSLRLTGIDLWGSGWDYELAICAQNVAREAFQASFERMDAARLAFPDATFDVVASVMCFHEVRIPGRQRHDGPVAAVREALRVLRPGGSFVLIDRFADPVEFGPSSLVDAALSEAVHVQRVPLGDLLELPWPLDSKHALGPVQVITGTRPTRS
jgi:SAM-dependent methyltransferase